MVNPLMQSQTCILFQGHTPATNLKYQLTPVFPVSVVLNIGMKEIRLLLIPLNGIILSY